MAFDRKAYMKQYRKRFVKGVGKGNRTPRNSQPQKPETGKRSATMKNPIQEIKEKQETFEIEDSVSPVVEETVSQVEETKVEETQTQETETAQTETNTEQTETIKDDSADFFKNLNSQYKEKPKDETTGTETEGEKVEPVTETKKDPEQNKLLISGYMFLLALNVIYPAMLLSVLGFFSKKYKMVDPDNIGLDETQMGMMEEIADEFIRVYLPKLNPMVLFLISYNGMLITNIRRELKNNKPIIIK